MTENGVTLSIKILIHDFAWRERENLEHSITHREQNQSQAAEKHLSWIDRQT